MHFQGEPNGMKIQNARKSESGQALVLIMFAVVGLLGFSALAIDLGWVLSERRQAQNAADGAAYAAAMAAINTQAGVSPQAAALTQAQEFGYDNVQVTVNHPPASGPYQNDPLYYQVLIDTEVQPVFSHLVFDGMQKITVEAVVRAQTPSSPSAGNAIHATKANGAGITFSGNVSVEVSGGNIYALDDMVKNGNGSVQVNDGQILAYGTWSGHTSNVDPYPVTGPANVSRQIIEPIDPPNCAIPYGTMNNATETMTHGRFPAGTKLNGGDWEMEPGLYCFEGDFTVNGNVTVTGTDVMIVMLSGKLKFNGNGAVNLTRPSAANSANHIPWGGMLLYAHPGSEIQINGTNGSVYSGTVFAPDSHCDIGGTADTYGIHANLICYDFTFHGNPLIDIVYKVEENYRLSPALELVQ